MTDQDPSPTIAARIIRRAIDDPDFRERLRNSPREAVLDFGVTLPEGFELRVVQEQAHLGYLVLPATLEVRDGAAVRRRVDEHFGDSAFAALGGGDVFAR